MTFCKFRLLEKFAALALVLGFSLPLTLKAETYVVASQNIAYFPHYEFLSSDDKGYAWALLEEFAKVKGVTFEYVSMPVLRLQIELEKGNIDLVYPDHPTWTNPVNDNATKFYSEPLTNSLVGTFVKPEYFGKGIDSIRKVSIILGFSPLYWQDRIDSGKTTLISVADAKSAIYMAQWNRADAFDMDYYVARHLLNKLNDVDDFNLDPLLPVTVVEFCLSTLHRPELLTEISTFIKDNPAVIQKLKARYKIGDPQEALRTIKVNAFK